MGSANSPGKDTIVQFDQSPQCSEEDHAILSKLTGGTAEGSLGMANYHCFWQSWSIVSLVDTDVFAKCLNEKTAVSTACGTCYADFTAWGITNYASVCMSPVQQPTQGLPGLLHWLR